MKVIEYFLILVALALFTLSDGALLLDRQLQVVIDDSEDALSSGCDDWLPDPGGNDPENPTDADYNSSRRLMDYYHQSQINLSEMDHDIHAASLRLSSSVVVSSYESAQTVSSNDIQVLQNDLSSHQYDRVGDNIKYYGLYKDGDTYTIHPEHYYTIDGQGRKLCRYVSTVYCSGKCSANY